ncbi:MAG TPA: DNA polymerase Y family protein [Puia sp.]|nr:DNA polymerase Y family protein [Puia sp.]
MPGRFVSIWLCHLRTDWFTRRQPSLQCLPFALALPEHGKMIITAASPSARAEGIHPGIAVADARAMLPGLQVFDDIPQLSDKLLRAFAVQCIRYSPSVTLDPPDGLLLDVSGCPHLWGGEKPYITEICNRFKSWGYAIEAGMADTVGTAWAVARFGQGQQVVESGRQREALLTMPPDALRLEPEILERLYKLGLRQAGSFIGMPSMVLRRRFGPSLVQRLQQALGYQEEPILPVQPPTIYQERLPALEPIATITGIEIALQQLLQLLCTRLQQDGKGLRQARFSCYRIDGKTESICIGTNRATHHAHHLFKLFELKLSSIEPALGIDLFILEAQKVEDVSPVQEEIWKGVCGPENTQLSELLDRVAGKFGTSFIQRYLPAEHYWPERSFQPAPSLQEQVSVNWKNDKPRPLRVLPKPEPIEVTSPLPDYPPMFFRYRGTLHSVKKSNGPERIERPWWLDEGPHRDYFMVEDQDGFRFWLFRSGHYAGSNRNIWFIHGFFA